VVMADDRPSTCELEPREPTVEDLRELCRELKRRQARYVVVGGFAIRAAGYNRRTMDVDMRHWFAERGQEPPKSS
jgi:hypothetical protein